MQRNGQISLVNTRGQSATCPPRRLCFVKSIMALEPRKRLFSATFTRFTETLDINLLPKLTNLLKQDSSKCSSHMAIILQKYVQFYLFFHIMGIFLFLGKPEKGQVGVFVLCIAAFKSYTPRNYTAQEQSHTNLLK